MSSRPKPIFKPDDCRPLTDAVGRGEVAVDAWGRDQYPGSRISAGRLPGLRSIGCWNAVGPQSWGLPMHRNEGIEICYLLSGELAFATDHESVLLRPGDITITRPWQRHRVGDPHIRASHLFWLILDVENARRGSAWEFPSWIGPDADSRRELLAAFRKNQRCHLADDGFSLKDLLLRSGGILAGNPPLAATQVAAAVNQLVVTVARMLRGQISEQPGDPYGFDRTILEFFRGLEASADKAAEPWTVATMARACRVGVTYLTKSSREIFNATPCDQLQRIRLAHGARLLAEDPGRSITEIAFRVGFSTSQHFATRFRRQYQTTPQQFRAARAAASPKQA